MGDGTTNHSDRNRTAGLVLLGAVCLFAAIFQGINLYDEGFILVGAARVARGEVPYRDFWAMYAPAQYYTLAGLFHLFGYSILVERIWDSLMRLGICLVVFAMSRRLYSRTASYVSFLATLLLLARYGAFGYPTVPAMFWSLLSILLLLSSVPKDRLRGVFLSGCATGVAVLYRHDLGIYTWLSAAAALFLSLCWHWREARLGRTEVTQRMKALLAYGAGTCLVVVPFLICLIKAVPLSDLRADILDYPRIYSRFRSLPLPPILPRLLFLPEKSQLGPAYEWSLFYAPLVVLAISWVMLLHSLWKSQAAVESQDRRFGWILLTLAGSSFVATAVVRPEFFHLLPMTIPAIILVPLLLAEGQSKRSPAWVAGLVRVSVLVVAVLYIAGPIFLYSRGLYQSASGKKGTSSLPRARLLYVDHDQEDAVRYIQRHVPEGRAIFVGNAQHRDVISNDALFYYLAERPAGTRYFQFDPGVITTAAVQQEVVRDLERNQVNYVVLCSQPGFAMGGADEPHFPGASLLDEYLRRKYRKVELFGYYSIWKGE